MSSSVSQSDRDADTAADPKVAPSKKRPRLKTTHRLTAALFGGLFGLVVSVVVLVLVYRSDLPRIDRSDYTVALQRWQESAVLDYDLSVEVKLHQATVYQVSVRGGTVVAVKSNGSPLRRQHAFDTWSVAGMFETLRTDLDQADSPKQVVEGKECRVLLRGTFDSEYGYPSQVLRIETREKGTNPEVAWKVLQFEVVPPSVPQAKTSAPES